MGLSNLMGMLSQYAGGAGSNTGNVENDFNHVSQNADPSHLASGLSGMFGSGQGSSFPQTIGNLFSNSNGQQQAGILGHLMQAAGPVAAGGILGHLFGGSVPPGLLTPEQAQQVSPQAVQELATHAQQNNPSIVDTAGEFYAQHPTVVKALGAGALAMVMSHMSQR